MHLYICNRALIIFSWHRVFQQFIFPSILTTIDLWYLIFSMYPMFVEHGIKALMMLCFYRWFISLTSVAYVMKGVMFMIFLCISMMWKVFHGVWSSFSISKHFLLIEKVSIFRSLHLFYKIQNVLHAKRKVIFCRHAILRTPITTTTTTPEFSSILLLNIFLSSLGWKIL